MKIDKEKISEIKEILNVDLTDSETTLNFIGNLLSLSEENFEIVAPGILESWQRSLNNPNDRVVILQSFLASGITSENLEEEIAAFEKKLDEMTELSVQKKDFVRTLLRTMVSIVSETEGVAKKFIPIPVELCREGAIMPQYAHVGDSGMDVFAIDDYDILPGETKLIPTGIKMALPPGYEIQIRPKSGRALKTKLRIANTPATVDAEYRGEIQVIIENIEAPIKDIEYHFNDNNELVIDSILHGTVQHIGKGEKFCQLVLMEVPKASLFAVEHVLEETDRGAGGFGSTGLTTSV